MARDVHRSIWMGRDSVSLGDVKIDGEHKRLFFRPLGLKKKFISISGNAAKVIRQEKQELRPAYGFTGKFYTVYWSDIYLRPYEYQVSQTDRAAISHLKMENERLRMENNRLIAMVYSNKNEDLNQKKVQKQKQFIDSIRPPYFNTFGGEK